jgi:hypothetical protein
VSALLHEVTLVLEPLPVSASKARAFVTSVLAEVGRSAWAESAQLAVSEIVTNAVLHAHTRVDVTVQVNDLELRVEVRDDNPTCRRSAPTSRAPRPAAAWSWSPPSAPSAASRRSRPRARSSGS